MLEPKVTAWHTPPRNQGQIVLVSYGIDEDGTAWQKTFDQSDRSTSYEDLGPIGDFDEWEPWNSEPA